MRRIFEGSPTYGSLRLVVHVAPRQAPLLVAWMLPGSGTSRQPRKCWTPHLYRLFIFPEVNRSSTPHDFADSCSRGLDSKTHPPKRTIHRVMGTTQIRRRSMSASIAHLACPKPPAVGFGFRNQGSRFSWFVRGIGPWGEYFRDEWQDFHAQMLQRTRRPTGKETLTTR